MKYYVISDTHFNHKEIIGYCNRPENHEQLMLTNLMIGHSCDATLIHLGDFALGNEAEACKRLSQYWLGRKVLVIGNHDSKSISWICTKCHDETHRKKPWSYRDYSNNRVKIGANKAISLVGRRVRKGLIPSLK